MIYGLQYSSIKKLHFAQQQCLLTALRLVTVCIGLILGAVFLKNTLACLFCFDLHKNFSLLVETLTIKRFYVTSMNDWKHGLKALVLPRLIWFIQLNPLLLEIVGLRNTPFQTRGKLNLHGRAKKNEN